MNREEASYFLPRPFVAEEETNASRSCPTKDFAGRRGGGRCRRGGRRGGVIRKGRTGSGRSRSWRSRPALERARPRPPACGSAWRLRRPSIREHIETELIELAGLKIDGGPGGRPAAGARPEGRLSAAAPEAHRSEGRRDHHRLAGLLRQHELPVRVALLIA